MYLPIGSMNDTCIKTDCTKILLLNIKRGSSVLNVNAREFHQEQMFIHKSQSLLIVNDIKVLNPIGRK